MTDRLGETMNWSRLVGVAAASLLLGGCSGAASTTGQPASSGTSAHGPHGSTDHAVSTPDATPLEPMLLLNGNLDARPGQLVDIRLDSVSRAQGHDAVTARSPAFSGPVRLRWQDGSYRAVQSLPMTDTPGRYPLTVAVAGRTVARDSIQVVRSERPSFTVTPASGLARPGEPLGLHFDDLYPGERGTDFTVRSAALPGPVRLVHDEHYDFYNPRAFSAGPVLRTGLADGTYTVGLYGPHGRRISEKRLKVRASRPGDADYLGKAYGPDFYDPRTGYSDSPRRHDFSVRPGGQVAVMWHDVDPDPGEETRLIATSPAFTHALRLHRDDSKASDGDDPRYFGTATVRADIEPGRYAVKVVAHHGRVSKVGYVTVTAR